ncbi:MAG: DUF3015 family protein [Deltaproteobacteria bacterium]|nr:DUF3015 family protein [Deltaproteobacteria bacterium]
MLPGVSHSAGYNENTGCGLGNQLFKEIGQDSVLFQIVAVTTNGILGNQTFAISSGTLGCKKPTKVVENEKVQKFVADNMDTIAQDIATGRGESLDTLAELMGIPAEKKAEFYASLQSNFTKIYTSESVQSADVIDNISSIN